MSNFLTLQEQASYTRIRQMLCRLRVKLAMERNKDHLIHIHSSAPRYNYHTKKQNQSKDLLCSLFPPRKKWKKPGKNRRFNNDDPRSTSEKTMQSLLVTLYHYDRVNPTEPSMVRLNNFIKEIQESIFSNEYKISKPVIVPKPKEDKLSETEENICRPIASFGLKDKVILSIVNRYLTTALDPVFLNESFAFRGKRDIKGVDACPTHHDAVQEILDYRQKFEEGKLWVSECDMKKFFDTVNHTVIKRVLSRYLKNKKLTHCNQGELNSAKRILYDYIDVYTFYKNVLPLNLNQDYFKKYDIPNGKFGWVEADLLQTGYYKRIASTKIGIPQGGALSGLIANAVLHDIDKKVMRHQDGSLLYVRFCDDMLLIHPEHKICETAFNAYIEGLKGKKLIPHSPVNAPFLKPKDFWLEKSKGCYQWNSEQRQGSPWIGFVGYEVHYQGDIRVRKSSLLKEMKKQYKVVGDLKAILGKPDCRSANNTIYESVANRLIGMSVGRITLWNYQTAKTEMCWASGYKLLSKNKHCEIQLRRLDTSRSRLLGKLRKKIREMSEPASDDINIPKQRQHIYYGRPFSYYYQVLRQKP